MTTSRISLKPNRLTITPQPRPKSAHNLFLRKIDAYTKAGQLDSWQTNFKVRNSSFNLSSSTKRKIFDSINLLHALSKPRAVKMRNGKTIFNFRAAFVTLSLPSVQAHEDIEIKKQCLNQFLIELRKHYGVKNYVWKAELQMNENIHFHIVLDKYVDFQALRRRWNRCINKLGYVDAYKAKMSALSLSEYHALRCSQGSMDFVKNSQAFAKGKTSKWANPNSVDVKSVNSTKSLASYLAKYISKSFKDNEENLTDCERGMQFGRIWARSQSLSGYKTFAYQFDDTMQMVVNFLKKNRNKTKVVKGEFYKIYFFNLDQLTGNLKKWLERHFIRCAFENNYPFPISLKNTVAYAYG